jgi:hypothetical protein
VLSYIGRPFLLLFDRIMFYVAINKQDLLLGFRLFNTGSESAGEGQEQGLTYLR